MARGRKDRDAVRSNRHRGTLTLCEQVRSMRAPVHQAPLVTRQAIPAPISSIMVDNR